MREGNKRDIYLSAIPVSEALTRVMVALDRDALVAQETISVIYAVGRVLAEPVYARFSVPTFHSAAMDGIAVEASWTFGAREDQPLILRHKKDFMPVNTGNLLPAPYDAVIMIEHVTCDQNDSELIYIEAPAFPGQHVRRIGEDIVATELLFPRYHCLVAYDLGALLGAGLAEVLVFEQLRLAIIPTGDELLNFADLVSGQSPLPGQVVESNSRVLGALAMDLGCAVQCYDSVPDRMETLVTATRAALTSSAHVVMLCAGSSAGSKDFTRAVFEHFGKVLVHGIAIMPGKPSIVGIAEAAAGPVGRGKLLVGVPGYPVSAVVCFQELLAPLFSWLGRRTREDKPMVVAELTRCIPSKLGIEEVIRLSIGRVGEKYVAVPIGRGAGNITTLCRAQGLTRIPAASEGLEQGSVVRVELLVPMTILSDMLIIIGSHDNTLDILSDELMALDETVRLTSSHVGSISGIAAIKNGSAHLAGVHLFDPATGDYNFPFLDKYLPQELYRNLIVVNLAIRYQGLIVARGNPKGIRGVGDLCSDAVKFVNRQPGAGTRILLDYYLQAAGITAMQVSGYSKIETTHMAVATSVLTGAADCGLGIFAAARALGLDFIPLARERYDLLIPGALASDRKIVALLALLHEPRVLQRIEAQGGYDVSLTGQLMRPGLGLGDGQASEKAREQEQDLVKT